MADTPLDPKAREALNAYPARTSPPDAARLDAIWQSVDAPRIGRGGGSGFRW